MHDLLTIPTRADWLAELRTVQHALDVATSRGERIRREIAATSSIPALAGLHDALELVAQEQQDAQVRANELRAMLAQ